MDGGPVMLSWRDVADAGESADVGLQRRHPRVRPRPRHARRRADGMPRRRRACAPMAARASSDEYERFASAVDAGEDTLLDPYGAEAIEEFFAVAAEAFFVAPTELRAEEPRAATSCSPTFFRQDPAALRPLRDAPGQRKGAAAPFPVAHADGQAVAGSAFGLSLFFGRLDVEQRLAFGVDVDRQAAAVDQAPEQQLVGQRTTDRVLDQALHRPRAHQRVEALLGQVLAQRVGEGDLDLLLGQLALPAAAGTCRPRAG